MREERLRLALQWLLKIKTRVEDYYRCRSCRGWEGYDPCLNDDNCADAVQAAQEQANKNRKQLRAYCTSLVR